MTRTLVRAVGVTIGYAVLASATYGALILWRDCSGRTIVERASSTWT